MRIGNLNSLPWYLRLVMFVAVAAVMYAGFWYFVTKPISAGTQSFRNKDSITTLRRNTQVQNRVAEIQ